MGIDVDRVIVATFFIGSALAGAAGVFNGLVYQQVWPYMGFHAGLKAFTAAVVGGIGNLPGAVVGGLVIGLDAVVLDRLHLVHLQDAIVFAILIAVHDPAARAACSGGRRCRRYDARRAVESPRRAAPPSAIQAARSASTSGSPRTRRRSASSASADPGASSSACRGRPSISPFGDRGGDRCRSLTSDDYIDPRRLRHAAVHAAGARPEHRRRLRGSARPRLRRLLRLRRVRLRDARVAEVRPSTGRRSRSSPWS